MKIEIEITGCGDCIYLKSGRSYGNDGRDGTRVFYCLQGAFGQKGAIYRDYDMGLDYVPKVPPKGCPYFDSDTFDLLAQDLRISTDKLKDLLNKYNVRRISATFIANEIAPRPLNGGFPSNSSGIEPMQ